MHIPLQEGCDPTNPEEAFLWALVGLPGPRGAPMLLSPKILRKWSQHLWELGIRHEPSEQKREYHPPARGAHHWVNGAGRWVDKGTARAPRITAPDITMFTPEERTHLVRQLIEHGELKHLATPQHQPNTAIVGRARREGHGHAGNAEVQ
ncbi:phage gene 29 protein family protein [Nocardia sp. NBC_01327]|uniref:phage gene 29 protein family protein n=1 Tax=Nocardia sp. NBC_01327 TaxID=2903593 RepID=UPI002E12ADF3|nr:DUF2744 domain-containing protein [Nocardia sp. NBC_01327]